MICIAHASCMHTCSFIYAIHYLRIYVLTHTLNIAPINNRLRRYLMTSWLPSVGMDSTSAPVLKKLEDKVSVSWPEGIGQHSLRQAIFQNGGRSDPLQISRQNQYGQPKELASSKKVLPSSSSLQPTQWRTIFSVSYYDPNPKITLQGSLNERTNRYDFEQPSSP